MSFTDRIVSKIAGWDPHPEPANPKGPIVPVEDFNGDSRVEVTAPKGGAR